MSATAADPATVVVIPVRMRATRLPGKPLADIHGTPMVLHVWRRAVAAGVGPVYVASGDAEILEVVERAGGRTVPTDPDLPSGTDRVRAAVAALDPQRRIRRVVNLQGDLPTIDPAAVARVLEPLALPGTDMATLVAPTHDPFEREDPHVVKAVVAFDPARPGFGRALYFTRAPAPWGEGPVWHHIGIYAFTRDALERFAALPPSPLERRERLEQLRALEHGLTIGVATVDSVPFGVDTPEDLRRARELLEGEPRP